MRISIFAVAATVFLINSLSAFEGLYIGGSGGASALVFHQTGVSNTVREGRTDPMFLDADFLDINPEGTLFVGYGLKWNRFYSGIEGFLRYSHPKFNFDRRQNADLEIVPGLAFISRKSNETHVDIGPWHYGVDWRFGILANCSTLIYGRFGVEWTRTRFDSVARFFAFQTPSTPIADFVLTPSEHKRESHLRAGLGIETFLNSCFSLRADYLYTSYGKLFVRGSTANGVAAFNESTEIQLHNHALTLGLSYYFNSCQPYLFSNHCCSSPFRGFYLAAAIGGSLFDAKVSGLRTQNFFGSSPVINFNVDPIPGLEETSGIGLGIIGYGFQCKCLFLGLEAFGSYAHHSRSLNETAGLTNFFIDTFNIDTHAKIEPWQFGIQFRPGIIVNNSTLLFGTIGTSRAKIRAQANGSADIGALVTMHTNKSNTQATFRVGGGIEHALSSCWHIRGDYIYTNYGSLRLRNSATATSLGQINTINEDIKLRFRTHDITIGISRYF